MKYILYDAEIVKCIPQRDTPNDPQFDYCEGWHDHAGMGISVMGVIDHTEILSSVVPDGIYRICKNAFIKNTPHMIIGFNSRNFDDRLLQAHGINVTTDYDILEEVRIAAGFAADYRSVPYGYSYKLDAIAKANGMAKTGSGELAPVLWQQGKRQQVIDYCLHDCRITRTVLELGLAGELVDPNTGSLLQLRPLLPSSPS